MAVFRSAHGVTAAGIGVHFIVGDCMTLDELVRAKGPTIQFVALPMTLGTWGTLPAMPKSDADVPHKRDASHYPHRDERGHPLRHLPDPPQPCHSGLPIGRA
jgi:hypothetical protein